MRLIVTADDFGLSLEINAGIVKASREGIVTSASLLMNAPETEEAVKFALENPNLEIGIHLGFVEGFSLLGRSSTLTDKLQYLTRNGGASLPCLHRHWKQFLPRYLTGGILLQELEEELDLQCQSFFKFFPQKREIPFANGTQHLHLLPGIQNIVMRLAKKYRIRALRCPGLQVLSGGRFPFDSIVAYLGGKLRKLASQSADNHVVFSDGFLGFEVSGSLSTSYLKKIIKALAENPSITAKHTFELMAHPGYDAPHLRKNLPWAYTNFQWHEELVALTDPTLKSSLIQAGIQLTTFGEFCNGSA